MLKIALDTYGNDSGESVFVDAVVLAVSKGIKADFILYGDKDHINKFLSEKNLSPDVLSHITIVEATEKIEINEHPVFALRSKTNSSLALAGKDLSNDKVDALISSGSTGAVLALGQLYIKTIDGIKRPAIASVIPTNTVPCLLIDCGANMDPEPEWLHGYAILGSIYMEKVLKVNNPRVGLLNVGVEETKGDKLATETYKLLKEDSRINFIGNVEARDFLSGACDVLVASGFNGNVLLKTYEGVAKSMLDIIKQSFMSSIVTKLAALIIKKRLKMSLKKYDADIYGGAILAGCRKLIIKCHGNATSKAIYHAIVQASEAHCNKVIDLIKDNIRRTTWS